MYIYAHGEKSSRNIYLKRWASVKETYFETFNHNIMPNETHNKHLA